MPRAPIAGGGSAPCGRVCVCSPLVMAPGAISQHRATVRIWGQVCPHIRFKQNDGSGLSYQFIARWPFLSQLAHLHGGLAKQHGPACLFHKLSSRFCREWLAEQASLAWSAWPGREPEPQAAAGLLRVFLLLCGRGREPGFSEGN